MVARPTLAVGANADVRARAGVLLAPRACALLSRLTPPPPCALAAASRRSAASYVDTLNSDCITSSRASLALIFETLGGRMDPAASRTGYIEADGRVRIE